MSEPSTAERIWGKIPSLSSRLSPATANDQAKAFPAQSVKTRTGMRMRVLLMVAFYLEEFPDCQCVSCARWSAMNYP
jgi:hypothetical protein